MIGSLGLSCLHVPVLSYPIQRRLYCDAAINVSVAKRGSRMSADRHEPLLDQDDVTREFILRIGAEKCGSRGGVQAREREAATAYPPVRMGS